MLKKVFINGYELEGIRDLSVQYRVVPELSSCTVTLFDPGGLYVAAGRRGKWPIAPSPLRINLEEHKRAAKIRVDHNVPVFKDNDIIHVFEYRKDSWWWVFHGFVTNVEYTISPDGTEIISLGCESGLKSLRYNHTIVNSLNIPREFSEGALGQFLNKYWSAFHGIHLEHRPYFEQLEILFHGDAGEVESGITQGEGWYKVKQYQFNRKEQLLDFAKGLTQLNRVELGPGQALSDYVRQKYQPQEKTVHVIALGLMPIQEVGFVRRFSVTNPVLEPKLLTLQNIIRAVNFLAYTLPCGDVVVEPAFYGEVGETSLEAPYVAEGDTFSARYSFSGSHLKTVVFTNYEPQLAPGMREFTAQAVSLDEDTVRHFGFRVKNIEEQSLFMRCPESALLYRQFLLGQSWNLAKTASVSARWTGAGMLNRPLFIQRFDGWFLLSSFGVRWEPTGTISAQYDLGYGMLWDGHKHGVEMEQAKSNLDFLFELHNIFLQKERRPRIQPHPGVASNTSPLVDMIGW